MAVRKFKAGDRVQQKSGGPVMEVIKYAMDHLPLGGETYSDHHVVCAWYDEIKNTTSRFLTSAPCLRWIHILEGTTEAEPGRFPFQQVCFPILIAVMEGGLCRRPARSLHRVQ